MMAEWLSDHDGPVPLAIVGGRGKCDAGLTGREGLYSRSVSIGILGDFTESGGKLVREPARLRRNGLTDDSLAPPRATVCPKERPCALRKLAL